MEKERNENEFINKFKELEEKLDKIYLSVEKTRKYFLFTMVTTIVIILLPVFGFLFIIPKIIRLYSDTFLL
jgi:hypothetical protein